MVDTYILKVNSKIISVRIQYIGLVKTNKNYQYCINIYTQEKQVLTQTKIEDGKYGRKMKSRTVAKPALQKTGLKWVTERL